MSPQQGEPFGSWLARQLRRAEMTQAQLADQIPITRAAVSAWINGRAEPRPETQRRIAEILGTDPASIYNRRDVTSDSPLRWHHRAAHLDGGREYGNPAAFAFDADLSMLTREATQNSLDERYDSTKPVRVRYTLHEVTGEHLDAFLDAIHWPALRKHYARAAAAEQKVSRSLQAALDDLDQKKSLVLLKIDDYNASGLTGDEYDDGRFAAVVRRQLDSHKSSKGAGGSYGLGKVTLWAASRFSLVLINSTLSEPHEGHVERRVIGRLDLPWREVDGEAYAGPGWFGQADTEPERKNVSRSWWADRQTVKDLHLERLTDEPGTSFLIVGAHDASGATETLHDMHEKLVQSLADGFWAAMIGGRDGGPLLEASVVTMRNGRVFIEEERVDPRKTHAALSRAFQAYLNGETVDELTSSTQVARADVRLVVPPRRGATGERKKATEHDAVLLVTPAEDGDEQVNQVVYMRGTRMTVMAKRPRELPLGAMRFHAVLLAGEATNRKTDDVEPAEQFLRASEPPEHDRWDHTEELTSTYARGSLSRLREFRAEIDAAVRRLVGRRVGTPGEGPAALRELLKLDGFGASARRAQGFPTVRNVRAHVDDTGAWNVMVDLKLPEADDPWLLTPVAKFDVRSGGRPAVTWKELVAAENCRRENDNLVIEPGVRSASFSGVTDPATHPVSSSLARLIIDLQKARGGAA
jgi:transcriptional regulator with XRE-family HTH domain